MDVADVEPPLTTGFRRWSNDLHRAELVVWSDVERFPATLEDRRPDGTVVLSADPHALAALEAGQTLSMLFRADERPRRRRAPAPLVTNTFTVDHAAGRVTARFHIDAATEGHHILPDPIAVSLESRLLFRRTRTAHLVRLSPYGGELVLDDPGATLAPGMVVTVGLWLPWTGPMTLQAQLTSYREERGSQFTFRVVDRASMRRAAVILVGSVHSFHFADLRNATVRPSRMTRYLTVRSVSDDATFRRALDLRLLGNRAFGRLAAVCDGATVADHLDPHAINFVVLLGTKVIGAGRVVTNDGDRARSEIESESAGLPEQLWTGGFVEVSRVVVHPDYRSAGVVIALFREVARVALALDCRYLVLDAIEKLVPMYEKVGATRLPISKTHPYSRETVQVMAIDIGKQLGHLDRRSAHWQYVFGPVLHHHLTTAATRPLDGFVHGARRVPFWLKTALSRLS